MWYNLNMKRILVSSVRHEERMKGQRIEENAKKAKKSANVAVKKAVAKKPVKK